MALDALLVLEIRLLAAAGASTLLCVVLTWRAWSSTSRTLAASTDSPHPPTARIHRQPASTDSP